MATTKPRITITLTDKQHALLKSMSESTGSSMSFLVSDLLNAAEPAMERMASGFLQIKNLQLEKQNELKQKLAIAMGEAESVLTPLSIQAFDQLDFFIDSLAKIHSGEGTSPPLTNRGDSTLADKSHKPKPDKAKRVIQSRKILKKKGAKNEA